MSNFDFDPPASYYEPPPEPCPECGGESRHARECEIGIAIREAELREVCP